MVDEVLMDKVVPNGWKPVTLTNKTAFLRFRKTLLETSSNTSLDPSVWLEPA